jgi:uncharacterized protein with PQ loop repeat
MAMSPPQIVALLAASLGVFGPGAQLVHVLRTRSTVGLSLATFIILNLSIMCSVLLSAQYATGPALYFAATSLVLKLAVLFIMNRLAALILISLVGTFSVLVHFGPAFFTQLALTSQYAEFSAFAWGLLLAIAFLPQVFVSHRTKDTRALSFVSLAMTSVGTMLWMTFAALVQNYAMLMWCAIMLIALIDLLVLKLGGFQSKVQQPAQERA